MKWNVGTKIGLGFAICILVFVFVGTVCYRSTTQLVAASEQRKDTYEMLQALDEVLSLLKDVEIGQRSYLLTGDESFLEPYQTALGKISPAVETVRTRAKSNVRHQQRLDRLEGLIQNRLAFAKETLDAHRTNSLEAAAARVKSGKGKDAMDEIRKLVGEMDAEDSALLEQRIAAAENDAQMAKWTIVVGTLAALVLAGLAGFVIARNIAQPLQALTQVADRITVGDLNVSVSTDDRSDEVGALARTFSRMTQSLRAMAGAAQQIAAVICARLSNRSPLRTCWVMPSHR